MGATMGAILKIGLFSTLNFGQILLPLPSSKGAQHIWIYDSTRSSKILARSLLSNVFAVFDTAEQKKLVEVIYEESADALL